MKANANLENVVLCGIPVVDVDTVRASTGSNKADERTPASHPRRKSQWYPCSDAEPNQRLLPGKGKAAERAGRSGCFAGVSLRRIPALLAGTVIPPGWRQAERGTCSAAEGYGFNKAEPTTLGEMLSRRSMTANSGLGKRTSLPQDQKKRSPSPVATIRTYGTHSVSTRG